MAIIGKQFKVSVTCTNRLRPDNLQKGMLIVVTSEIKKKGSSEIKQNKQTHSENLDLRFKWADTFVTSGKNTFLVN